MMQAIRTLFGRVTALREECYRERDTVAGATMQLVAARTKLTRMQEEISDLLAGIDALELAQKEPEG